MDALPMLLQLLQSGMQNSPGQQTPEQRAAENEQYRQQLAERYRQQQASDQQQRQVQQGDGSRMRAAGPSIQADKPSASKQKKMDAQENYRNAEPQREQYLDQTAIDAALLLLPTVLGKITRPAAAGARVTPAPKPSIGSGPSYPQAAPRPATPAPKPSIGSGPSYPQAAPRQGGGPNPVQRDILTPNIPGPPMQGPLQQWHGPARPPMQGPFQQWHGPFDPPMQGPRQGATTGPYVRSGPPAPAQPASPVNHTQSGNPVPMSPTSTGRPGWDQPIDIRQQNMMNNRTSPDRWNWKSADKERQSARLKGDLEGKRAKWRTEDAIKDHPKKPKNTRETMNKYAKEKRDKRKASQRRLNAKDSSKD